MRAVRAMIGAVLTLLRKHLDAHPRTELGGGQDDPSGDKVVFDDGDQMVFPFYLNEAATPGL
ncbi:hypothetical protein [Myxococcus sp. RHSTA-1-4]|uniref:hypothetical protein n=1 Tax=Myxococcus sp. RHSTA-1-4 TaxID=2874601 RepID=UPI001CBAFB2E|nr:hypothetical protein [Myxococcus sp. RHSTA-1-4]MBZ4420162.1 hypothetical protein [Myxococcus sp. RHSTA-1-4]